MKLLYALALSLYAAMSLAATPPTDSVTEADPVVGKWQFPAGIKIMNADGTCASEVGKVNAKWKVEGQGPDRKYIVIHNPGKVVDTFVLKEGNTILEGTRESANNAQRAIVIHRIPDGTPAPAKPQVVKPKESQPFKSAPTASEIRLDELTPLSAKVGHGPYMVNKFPDFEVKQGARLLVDGANCDHYLFAHANSEVSFAVPAGYSKFSTVGIAPSIRLSPIWIYRVLADGKSIFQSERLLTYPGRQVKMDVDLPKGTQTLTLVTEASNGTAAHSIWANPRFLPSQQPVMALVPTTPAPPTSSAAPSDQGDYLEDISGVARGALSAEYIQFMRTEADPWTRDHAALEHFPPHLPRDEWLKGMATLTQGDNSMVGDRVKHFRSEVDGIFQTAKEMGVILDRTNGIADNLVNRQQSGEFRRSGDNGSFVVDHAVIAAVANNIAAAAYGSPENHLFDAHNNVLYEFMHKLADIYPPSAEKKGLITPRLTPQGIELTNTSGQTLTNLTVYLELTHSTTAPHPMEYRAVFAGRLEKGAALYLNPEQTRNLFYPDWKLYADRPQPYTHLHGSDDDWVSHTGGTLRGQVKAYALEAHENAKLEFPENAVNAGRYEVTKILQILACGIDDERKWALGYARRVFNYVPQGSPVSADLKAILDHPDTATEKGRRMLRDFLSHELIGTYKGTYRFWPLGNPDPEIFERNGRGEMVLEISKVNDDENHTLEVCVFPPDHPDQKHAFKGKAPALERGKVEFMLDTVNEECPGPDTDNFTAAVRHFDLFRRTNTVIRGDANAKKVGSQLGGFHFNILLERSSSSLTK